MMYNRWVYPSRQEEKRTPIERFRGVLVPEPAYSPEDVLDNNSEMRDESM